MHHLMLLGYFISLMIGMWAVVMSHQYLKIYRYSFLRSLIHYIIFFNAALFLYSIAGYLELNFPESQFTDHNSTFFTVMYTLAILAWIGCIYSFIHLILGLRDTAVSSKVNRFFGIGIVIIGIMVVIGITTYIYTGSNSWMMGTYLGLMITAGFVFFSGAISLLRCKKFEKKSGEQKSITAYGWLNLAGYVLFFSAPFLHGIFKIYLVSIAIIFINLIPILWLKFYFLRHFMQFSSDENLRLLDIVSQKYQISKREREVMDLILQGKSNQEIEKMLFISYSTVKNHIYNIYQKLGVKSRGQMIRFVFEASRFEEKTK